MTYTATQGAANPSAQTIAISSNGTWTVSDNASWLSYLLNLGDRQWVDHCYRRHRLANSRDI